MKLKQPYVVAEIGPSLGTVAVASTALRRHVNRLPYRRIYYIALDPFVEPRINQADSTRTVNELRKAARKGVKVSLLKWSVHQDLPFRLQSLNELHSHATLQAGVPLGTNLGPSYLLNLARQALKRGGRLFVSGTIPWHRFARLTRYSDSWFSKRGFKVEMRGGESEAAAFSYYNPEKILVLRKR